MKQFYFLLCTCLISLLLAISCVKNDNVDSVKYKDNTISGEELFKTIFFLEGELAKKISYYQPVLAQIDKFEKQYPEYLDTKAQKIKNVVDLIKNNDNSYFDELKKSIESRDVKRVETAILRGTDLIKAVSIIDYSKINNSDVLYKYDLSNKDELKLFLEDNQLTYKKLLKEEEGLIQNITPNKEAFLFPYAVVAVAVWEGAVAVNVVAVATVAVVTKAAFWDPTESEIKEDDFGKDLFLKEITFDLIE